MAFALLAHAIIMQCYAFHITTNIDLTSTFLRWYYCVGMRLKSLEGLLMLCSCNAMFCTSQQTSAMTLHGLSGGSVSQTCANMPLSYAPAPGKRLRWLTEQSSKV